MHGLSGTVEYEAWRGAKKACTDPGHAYWKYYGARGVKMCERWISDFMNFLADIGPRPSRGFYLRLIDPNGNYEPGNCQWTKAHYRDTFYTHAGITDTIGGWAKRLEIPPSTFRRMRHEQGKTISEIAIARGFKP